MIFYTRKLTRGIIFCLLLGITVLLFPDEAKASGGTKIHFISLYSNADAILLESNGHYGMVDSGEDWDYPDGKEYPLREGTTMGIGYEQQVIHYLKQMGVEKLDFYIATHAHSDHIGSGDEILDYFPTDVLYINEYKDEYMFDMHVSDPTDPYYVPHVSGNHLWDNQYVYDNLIAAARRNGTKIITDLDNIQNEQYRTITMGDMTIEIMNYERERDGEGKIMPVPDDNCNCLVTKVTAFGKVALLTSDMDPWLRDSTGSSDTVKIAKQLIEQLGTEDETDTDVQNQSEMVPVEVVSSDSNVAVQEMTETEIVDGEGASDAENDSLDETRSEIGSPQVSDQDEFNQEGTEISEDIADESELLENLQDVSEPAEYNQEQIEPEISDYVIEENLLPDVEDSDEGTEPIDETKANAGKTISLDLLKMSHHSIDYNNTTYFLTSLNPKTVVITGFESRYNERERNCMPRAAVYATASDSAAVVAAFTSEGIHTEYVKLHPEWMELDGKEYYFDANGRTFTGAGNHKVGEKEYYFDQKGALDGESKWVLVDGIWRYWKKDGNYAVSEWIRTSGKKYYCGVDGNMVTGWQWINGQSYYFDSSGILITDAWINGHYVNRDGIWIAAYSQAKWIKSGGRWWYRYGNGEYPKNSWLTIDNSKYYFDKNGWMVVGWQKIGKEWYYFESSGRLLTDTWIGEYYVDQSGVWQEGLSRDKWIKSGNRWWYRHADGSYTRNDWEEIGGVFYYFDGSGWMVTGWQKIDNEWYYFEASGKMANNTWVGEYYVNGSGIWDTSKYRPKWIQSGSRWWYRHEDGGYTTSGWEKINGKWYYFDGSGWMVTGWRYVDNKWYYLNASGAMVSNMWIGNYYLKSDGSMAVSEWVDGDRYYVNENGVWVPNKR